MSAAKAETKTGKKKQSKAPLLVGLALIATLVGSYFIFPGFHDGVNEAFDVITSEDQDRIQTWVKQFGALGPIVLIFAMTVQMFMLIVPNILLFMISIICYGPIWGTLISLAGVTASSTIGYFIGKKLGPRAIDRFVSQNTQDKMCIFIERYGVKAVAIMRLSSLSSDALGFVAGILEMSYKRYILATLTGIVPVIILIAIYGQSGKIETALIWIAGISLILLIVYIILDKNKRREVYKKHDIKFKQHKARLT
ncbi:MAG TPA: TVP38/TMEM64 family protein [Cyclobacteriaceae bacterium]